VARMTRALMRPELLYAWHGQSLLIVSPRGKCGPDDALSGYYFREARFLRTLRLEIDRKRHLPPLVGRLFAPDMFSGRGIRTLSRQDRSYNPLEYHLGSIWTVESATIVFGLRRFGFDVRALELSRALFDLVALYPEYRIPECVGGYARGERSVPGAYAPANTPQLWNASGFGLLVHSIVGFQPVAPLKLLVVDPVLPTWLPEIVIHNLRLAGATATSDSGGTPPEAAAGRIAERRSPRPVQHAC
jgi:hypothetical protein